MGEVNAIKTMGSKENVGELFVCTRLFLYEACIIPSLLYQIETWSPLLKKDEMKQLESLQKDILCSLLHLPKTTTYWGLLHETGMWSIRWRVVYRKIMLYHNIMVGDDERLAKEILEQQIEEGNEESFANQVREDSAALGITDLTEHSKSQLKEKVKRAIRERMADEVKEEAAKSSKMRFIVPGDDFQQSEYIGELPGDDVLEVLKVRLNMVNIYGNYKNDLTKKRWCPHCFEERDTTEHLISCSALEGMRIWKEKDLCSTDAGNWRSMLETIRRNMESR